MGVVAPAPELFPPPPVEAAIYPAPRPWICQGKVDLSVGLFPPRPTSVSDTLLRQRRDQVQRYCNYWEILHETKKPLVQVSGQYITWGDGMVVVWEGIAVRVGILERSEAGTVRESPCRVNYWRTGRSGNVLPGAHDGASLLRINEALG